MKRMQHRKKTIAYGRILLFALFVLGGLAAIFVVLFWQSASPTFVSSASSTASTTSVQEPESASSSTVDTALQAKKDALLADWRLTLVNNKNPLPADWQSTLVDINTGNQVDLRIHADLTALLDACSAQGFEPLVCSGYRTREDQVRLFEDQTARYQDEGQTPSQAQEMAATAVARPDTSEHQLGFAVDIVSINNQRLDATQEENPAQVWLMKNSWRYGFILRYPKDKTQTTMKMYEPWHYRYVGTAYAKYMYENAQCLEEFLTALPVDALDTPKVYG